VNNPLYLAEPASRSRVGSKRGARSLHLDRLCDLQAELRYLLNRWDPIGIYDEVRDFPSDEYDCLTSGSILFDAESTLSRTVCWRGTPQRTPTSDARQNMRICRGEGGWCARTKQSVRGCASPNIVAMPLVIGSDDLAARRPTSPRGKRAASPPPIPDLACPIVGRRAVDLGALDPVIWDALDGTCARAPWPAEHDRDSAFRRRCGHSARRPTRRTLR